MRFIDLFAGIGGFRYGLERINKEQTSRVQSVRQKGSKSYSISTNGGSNKRKYACVWSNEWDKYAAKIYKKHYGECDTRDITTVHASEIPDHDLLCGGFPCQTFSVAGKRLGFDDTRGTLFYDIARIAKHKRPRHLLLENVKGLLSHDEGKTFQTMLGVLADIGYRVEWMVLNSKDFGVPQNRERVFIIGHFAGECAGQVFPLGEASKADGKVELRNDTPQQVSPTVMTPGGGYHTPTISYAVSHYGHKNKKPSIGNTVPTLKAQSHGHEPMITRQPLRYLNKNQKNIEGDYAFTVDASQTAGVKQGMKIRRLTPKECERLQGFPDGYTMYGLSDTQDKDNFKRLELISDTQRYKVLGNAVTTNVITEIGKALLEHL